MSRKFYDTGQALRLGNCKKNMSVPTSTAANAATIGLAGHFDPGRLYAATSFNVMKNIDAIGAQAAQ